MPPKKRATKGSGRGDNKTKKKRKKSFSSSDDFDDSDSGTAKIGDNNNHFKDNHNNSQHLDDDNGVTPEDLALMPKLSPVAGRLLVCGGTNWDLIGRKELPKAAKNAPQSGSGLSFKSIVFFISTQMTLNVRQKSIPCSLTSDFGCFAAEVQVIYQIIMSLSCTNMFFYYLGSVFR